MAAQVEVSADAARARRAARRAYVREHHPDRGGDVTAFVVGLARLDALAGAGAGAGEPAVRVVVIRRRTLRRRVLATVRRRIDPPPRRVR